MEKNTPDDRNSGTWERLCERCGLCCFEKFEDGDSTIYFTQTPCRYLDVVTRECRIYERRFAINPECIKLTPQLVRKLRWLHDGCGYVKALRRTNDRKEG